ncbi:uncharacterized protein [Drosophila virilis]|uniref:Uncharacterized protein n=1 Tax=Drosophila virilis TaxID=7244 RepID=A0A0Q9WNA9_DROVI|nr:uncharacterized protein LOC26530605 [Drosophila virilis]KRF82334.1 uncharacterized protein Dvir_GJ25835 [Drosophila virilis]
MSGIFKIFGTFYQLAALAANKILFGALDDEPSAEEDESQEESTDDADELYDDPINISSSPNKEREVHCVCEEVNGRLHKLYDLRDYVFDPQDDMQQAMRREAARQRAQAGYSQPLSLTRSIRRTVEQHLQFVSEDYL